MTDLGAMKTQLHGLLADLAAGADVSDIYHDDATLWGSHPVGEISGLANITEFWRRLRTSLPDMERRNLIFLGGENMDDPRVPDRWRAPHLVASIGHYQGTFKSPLFDIPATHGTINLRFSEAHYLDSGKIRRSWVFIDLLDLMRQANVWPLPRSLGSEGLWPGPASNDGVRLTDDGPSDTLATVFKMHNALLSFDGKTLDSMPHGQYWDPNFMYYAGAGIGSMRGLAGFRAHHQIPFLHAFPDRDAEGHFIRISDGDYAVTGGRVFGTHSAAYLGMTATHKTAWMPVMDFYRLKDGVIVENWLPIDILGMAHGLGNDLLARMRHYLGEHPTDL